MRIGDADHLSFVLKNEDVVHLGALAELAVLLLPTGQKQEDVVDCQFGERRVVQRTVADDAGLALGRAIAEQAARRGRQFGRRMFGDARQIVVEHKDARVELVASFTDARIARTEIAIGRVGWLGGGRVAVDVGTGPRPALPMSGDDHPLFAQGMPALFPGAPIPSWRMIRPWD